ncbi:hypothetical protein JCM11641_001448 [Rhodosporidiobolus odoratus]
MHAQECTEDSILEADGLAAYQAYKQEEKEELQRQREEEWGAGSARYEQGLVSVYGGTAQTEMSVGYGDRRRLADHQAASSSRPPPLHYRPFPTTTYPQPSPSSAHPSVHPVASFDSAPSFHPTRPHPSFPRTASLPRPTSSGSTPSYSAAYPREVYWPCPPAHEQSGQGYRDPFEGEPGDLASEGMAEGQEEPQGEEYDFHAAAGEYRHGVGYDSHSALKAADTSRGHGGKEAKQAERMRRLEAKFGKGDTASPGGAGRGKDLPLEELMRVPRKEQKKEKQEKKERIGVDSKGRLVTQGRRKRVALRWSQGIGPMVVGCGAIGAALLTHPEENPPPSGSAPLWALYLLPFLSLALTLFLHALRPTLYRKRIRKQAGPSQSPFSSGCPGGGMVVPLTQGGAGPGGRSPGGGAAAAASDGPSSQPPRRIREEERDRRTRRRRKKEKEKRRKRQREKRGGEPGDDAEELVSSSSLSSLSSLSSDEGTSDAWSATADPSKQRKGILSHFQHEEVWMAARGWAKKVAAAECVAGILWVGVGVWAIGWAGKCPARGFEGYCNLYNLALAFAILTSLVFFSSFVLGCIDLSRSKGANPRGKQKRIRGEEAA